jgi:hypothetical protein
VVAEEVRAELASAFLVDLITTVTPNIPRPRRLNCEVGRSPLVSRPYLWVLATERYGYLGTALNGSYRWLPEMKGVWL